MPAACSASWKPPGSCGFASGEIAALGLFGSIILHELPELSLQRSSVSLPVGNQSAIASGLPIGRS